MYIPETKQQGAFGPRTLKAPRQKIRMVAKIRIVAWVKAFGLPGIMADSRNWGEGPFLVGVRSRRAVWFLETHFWGARGYRNLCGFKGVPKLTDGHWVSFQASTSLLAV